MPQGVKDKNDKIFCTKMAVKVTKGQISNGTISKNTCIYEYYLSNQKQPSCKKRCGPQKGHGEKDVKSKVVAKKWL